MEKELVNEDYKDFIGEIKGKIRRSQYEAIKENLQSKMSIFLIS